MVQEQCTGNGGKCCGGDTFGQMCRDMGDYAPDTLKAIRELDPGLIDTIHVMDRVMVTDGALDKKTKRLIALSCVAVRMCEDCVYAQAKVAKNYGATKEEILEAINVAVLTGGVPCWSTAKKGIAKLFAEWDE
ncbi:carboxymuconolactone decarboxylase family protein [Candidatus Methanoprimaticola sp. MG2]|uniref:carboxymuconolactone decarboxylase family protein n=1 Tax=Candidatus Methanoprimaticola sp. MG2 TaxID=3228838 RepID=UPI0039C6409B